jgi:hypothetical protein
MRSAHPFPDRPKWHTSSRLETRLALGTGCRATLYRARTAQGAAVLVGAGLEEACEPTRGNHTTGQLDDA